MDFFYSLVGNRQQGQIPQQHIPLQPVNYIDQKSNSETEKLHWLNQGIRNACEALQESNKENRDNISDLSLKELRDIHVELKELFDFYTTAHPFLPDTVHLQFKFKNHWQTLVFQEIHNTVEISLLGRGGKSVTLGEVKNFMDLYRKLKEEFPHEKECQ